MDERLSVDFAMVSAVESIDGLRDQIWPLQPKKNARPPFCFYEQITDDEEEALDGLTGLQHTGFRLHVVTGGFWELSTLCTKIMAAIRGLTGHVNPRTDNTVAGIAVSGRAVADTDDTGTYVEYVTAKQTSPDLYESDVGFYRRIYEVDFFYQTERSTE